MFDDHSTTSAPPALPRQVIEHLPDPAIVLGLGGIVRMENAPARELFGGGVVGRPDRELLDVVGLSPAEGLEAVSLRDHPVTVRRLDGTPVPARVSCGAAWAGATIVTLREETDSRLLDRSRPFLDDAFELAPIGMAFFDTHGCYVRVNPALEGILGRPARELIGRRDQELTHPDDRESDLVAAGRILSGELSSWQAEKRFVRPDGSVVWVVANLSFLRDDGGRPLVWLGQFQDVTPRRRLEDRLRRLAEEDPLTGLPNRRRLDRELLLARRLGAQAGLDGALIVVDLDGLKTLNDTAGHAAGDDALRAVARALRDTVRATDTVARIGGDEFAVVLPLTDVGAARGVAGAIGAAIARVTVAGLPLSASIGTTVIVSDSPADSGVLLAEADAAMYRAKRTSARRVVA